MSRAFLVKFFTIAGGLAATGQMPGGDKPCSAHIEQTVDKDYYTFTGIFVNHLDEEVEGSYTLDAVREGKSGRSVSRQRGEFRAEPFGTSRLSKLKLNIQQQDAYTIVLKIYAGNVLFCSDTLMTGDPLPVEYAE